MSVIFITGGVCSGIGKGIITASLCRLFEKNGKAIFPVKIDPYLNLNAGNMGPAQHGEVFVLKDGTETDLDLGHYYRFTRHVEFTKENNITTGQIYAEIVNMQQSPNYTMGRTIQVVPDFSNTVRNKLEKPGYQSIVEIGGTVGDDECLPFMRAIRPTDTVIHVAHVLDIRGEHKTKPAQDSVNKLRSYGIIPKFLVLRSSRPMKQNIIKKVQDLTGVENVCNLEDVDDIYKVPEKLQYALPISSLGLSEIENNWNLYLLPCYKRLKIAILSKYEDHTDPHISLQEALKHAGKAHCIDVEVELTDRLTDADGYVIAGGFGTRGIADLLKFIKQCWKPLFGICLGYQLMLISKHQEKTPEITSEEFDNEGDPRYHLFKKLPKMRVGLHGSDIYRHRYQLDVNNPHYDPNIKVQGVQYHPEFLSKPGFPHVDLFNFIKKCQEHKETTEMIRGGPTYTVEK